MKTIEEKAKAYDEALERAKNIKSKILQSHLSTESCKAVSEYIDEIIPDLKESKDERMLKEFNDYLCEEIECRTNDLRDEEDRRTLNMLCYVLTKVKEWLKKQKESLHISESCKENADSFTSEDERIRKDLIHDIESLPIQGVLTHRPTDVYIAYLERQKEQKPNIEICPHSVKSKSYSETGYPIEDCDYGLEIALDILEKTLGKVQGFQTDDGIREHQTAIKAVKDAMEEQKPAWSEEDEKKRLGLIKGLENRMGFGWASDPFSREEYIDWLKSLRPQPHWKPSRAQMSMLLAVINEPNNASSESCHLVLAELYNELLKLKQP